MTSREPPQPTEIEVSIFGRGIGESILLHLGDSRWVVVDSLCERDQRATPLRYLEEIGHYTASAIALIVATHWHDDHVAGISQVYARAPNAVFSLPIAMRSQELRAFLNRVRDGGSRRFSSGVRELDNIAVLQNAQRRQAFLFAQAHTMLLERNAANFSHGQRTSIRALSPAPADTEMFLRRVAEAATPAGGDRVEPFHPNHISTALWVSIGEHRILLGADLETTTSPQCGWQAVVNSAIQLEGKARIVKAPHHGSENAHHQPVWDCLVMPAPLVAVTTYNRGVQLPKPSDQQRLVSLSEAAYMTSLLERRAVRRLNMVEGKIKDTRTRLRQRPRHTGQVRFRLDLAQPAPVWKVALFDGAFNLDEASAA